MMWPFRKVEHYRPPIAVYYVVFFDPPGYHLQWVIRRYSRYASGGTVPEEKPFAVADYYPDIKKFLPSDVEVMPPGLSRETSHNDPDVMEVWS